MSNRAFSRVKSDPQSSKQDALDTIAQRRGELRTGDENKTHVYHLAAFLMERSMTRKLGFNAFQVSVDSEILMRLGKRLANYALTYCNHGLNDSQARAREKVVATVKEIAAWYDLTAHCHGDPRGYVLRVDGDGVQKNGWGDGFGIA